MKLKHAKFNNNKYNGTTSGLNLIQLCAISMINAFSSDYTYDNLVVI